MTYFVPTFNFSATKRAPQLAPSQDADDGLALLEREPEKLKPPPRYAVLLLNDDYTPMEFVVAILRQVFNRSEDESVAIMLKVHNDGRGVCGVYTKDVAETRVAQVAELAKKFGHPLQCVAEPVDEG